MARKAPVTTKTVEPAPAKPALSQGRPAPEVVVVRLGRVACDGVGGALGHPRVWLEIDEHGYVDCGYCDRRFVLKGGPADGVDQSALRDIASGAS